MISSGYILRETALELGHMTSYMIRLTNWSVHIGPKMHGPKLFCELLDMAVHTMDITITENKMNKKLH